jgi:hypothetical protein
MRSYTDGSGGADNLVMFKKTGIGMRIWQQTFGSSTAYSSYADVWTTGDFTSTNVTNWNTAYGWGNHSGLYLGINSKAADSEAVDGIDSSRIVYGDGARASISSSSINDPNQKSGFYFYNNPTGQPFGEWWNWMTVAGNSWQSSNNYSFQIAHAFHSDDLYVRRMTNGEAYGWRRVWTDADFAISNYLPLSGGTLSGAVIVNLGNVTSDTVAFKVGGPSNYDSLTIGMEDTPDYDAFIASFGNDIRFYSGKGVSTEDHSFYWFTSKAGTSQHSVIAMRLDHNQNLTIGGTFTEQSSIRYKENVKSIPSVSQKIEQLDAVSYNKIGSNQEEIGLIAEDVAELFPEVVKYDNEGRPDGVNYSRLSVILLKAVQELTERVNKLENK